MPLYVLDKIPATNTLIIGTQYELGNNELVAVNVNWVSGECLAEPRELSIKIRYKADFASGIVSPLENNQVHIRFDNMLRDITPGQAAVFYDQDTVVGGGLIRGVGYNPAN